MKQITRKIVHAFEGRYALKIDNSRTDGTSLWLFNNKIADWRSDGLWITNARWTSATTKERLNGLSGVHIQQVRGNWLLNGSVWDGGWVNVGAWDRGAESIPEESVQEPEFDVTSEWVEDGYSKPVYAVYHTLVEEGLRAVEILLNQGGIPSRRMESDTEGVYRPNYFLVVHPENFEKAANIVYLSLLIINQIKMENQYYFKIFYDKVCVWSVVAHTKWEAIDKAYYKFIDDCPKLERAKFKAKRSY